MQNRIRLCALAGSTGDASRRFAAQQTDVPGPRPCISDAGHPARSTYGAAHPIGRRHPGSRGAGSVGISYEVSGSARALSIANGGFARMALSLRSTALTI